jgi:4,5-DOPA dioxygenase extradiol
MPETMPVIFLGHGNPMNAIQDNGYTKAWARLRTEIPRPEAILSISAHWYIPQTAVTAMPAPRTIHDFGGFPEALYQAQYPAPGAPSLANRVRDMLSPVSIDLDYQWGLDHGTWSVLSHIYPDADIPVVQLSIDWTKPPDFHYKIGKMLAPLREEGVLIMGSGNLVHNLHAYSWSRHPVEPFDWAVRFEKRVKELLSYTDDEPLINYMTLGKDAILSIPTPDHYLPLLYVTGCRRKDEKISFPVKGFDGGSVSMLSVQFG